MPRINMPPGCYGVRFKGVKEPVNSRPGGHIDVSDEQARAIMRSSNGQLGIISGRELVAIATKAGRWCRPCRFLAQSWSTECPRCGGPTEKE